MIIYFKSIFYLFVLCIAFCFCLNTISRSQSVHTILTGEPLELTFDSYKTNSISPPAIFDLSLNVEFYNESDTIIVSGFWAGRINGISSWKARFHPSKSGRWNWRTQFSDTTESSIHNKQGYFYANKGTSEHNLFDQHGWLRIAKSGRHLEHASAKPFFWQGDTAWEIAWKSSHEQVDLYLADRKSKGFNAVYLVVQSHQYLYDWGIMNRQNQPLFLENDFSRINPKYFDYLDDVITRINKSGLIAVIVPLWASLTEVHHEPTVHRRTLTKKQSFNLARYVGARYAGHNVVWIIGGDNNYDTEVKRTFWTEFSSILYDASGQQHLRTVHPSGYKASFDFFDFNTPWIDFHMFHSSHLQNSGASKILGWKGWQYAPAKPVINGEPAFEDIPAYFWNQDSTVRISSYDVRQSVWESFLSGALMGVTYGANGVWQWHVPKIEASHDPQNYVTESLDYPGSTQVSLLKSYFDQNDWWNLIPDPNFVKGNNPIVSPVGAYFQGSAWVYVPKGISSLRIKNIFKPGYIVIKYKNASDLSISRVDSLLTTKDIDELTLWSPAQSDWLLEIAEGVDPLSSALLNHRQELILRNEKKYKNPQKDVEVWAMFKHSSNVSETVRAFWDGDSIWKIRFKPFLTGTWSWETSSSDSLNLYLHKRMGSFNVTESDKTILRYGKGKQRIGVAGDKRTLVYKDGTPFFWLGDTAWEITWKSTPKQLLEFLDDRKKKGFTVIQIVAMSHQIFDFNGVVNRYGEAYFKNGNLDQLNPRYFDYLDFIVEEANKRDIVVAIVPLWAYMMELHHIPAYHEYTLSIEQSMSVADYIGARYAGDDVVWIVGGDNTYVTPKMKQFWSDWATRLKNASGGWHPMTVHPAGWTSSFDFFPSETSWLDFHMYQSSHLAGGDYTWQAARRGYELKPIKPIINGEPNYEDIYHNLWAPGDTNYVDTFRIRSEHVRQASWESILSGATGGITYGANGVWQWHTSELNGSHSPRFLVEEAWKFPGSGHMTILRNIAEQLDWHSWKPDPERVLFSNAPDIIPVSVNSKGIIAYLPSGTQNVALVVRPLSNNAKYQWINPTNGAKTQRTDIRMDTLNKAMIFSPPDHNDWLLHIFNPEVYTDITNEPELPNDFKVFPPAPNPFNPSTQITFELPGMSEVIVDIFSIDGRLVNRLTKKYYETGSHSLTFEASNLSSGVYLARVSTQYGIKHIKMTLIK